MATRNTHAAKFASKQKPFWTTFSDTFAVHSGRWLAIAPAIVAAVWLVAMEVSNFHVAMARVDQKMISVEQRINGLNTILEKNDSKTDARFDRVDLKLERLLEATEEMKRHIAILKISTEQAVKK